MPLFFNGKFLFSGVAPAGNACTVRRVSLPILPCSVTLLPSVNFCFAVYQYAVIPRVRSTRGNPHQESVSTIKGIATACKQAVATSGYL